MIGGSRYLRDAYGWVWREYEPHERTAERPERWLRTGYVSLEDVENVRDMFNH